MPSSQQDHFRKASPAKTEAQTAAQQRELLAKLGGDAAKGIDQARTGALAAWRRPLAPPLCRRYQTVLPPPAYQGLLNLATSMNMVRVEGAG